MHLIAGSKTELGHKNGNSFYARFGDITGMVTSPDDPKSLWIADYTNNCFRILNRQTKQVQDLTGNCGDTAVHDDNFEFAGVGDPIGLVSWDRDRVYFYDNAKPRIRCLYRLNKVWYILTTYRSTSQVHNFAGNVESGYFYLLRDEEIQRVSLDRTVSENIIDPHEEYDDGLLSRAGIKKPVHMIFLEPEVLLIADQGYHNLRVINLETSKISSVCLPQESDTSLVTVFGPINNCKLEYPTFIFKDGVNKVIRVLGYIQSYTLRYGENKLNII